MEDKKRLEQTRMVFHAQRRAEIANQNAIATEASHMDAKVAKIVADLDRVNPKILAKRDQTGVSLRKIAVIDNSGADVVAAVTEAASDIKDRTLAGYRDEYDLKIVQEPQRRTIKAAEDGGVELIAPKETLPYAKYDRELLAVKKIDLNETLRRLHGLQHISGLMERVGQIKAEMLVKTANGEPVTRQDAARSDQLDAEVLAAEPESALYRSYIGERVMKDFDVSLTIAKRGRKQRKYMVVAAAACVFLTVVAVAIFVAYAQGAF